STCIAVKSLLLVACSTKRGKSPVPATLCPTNHSRCMACCRRLSRAPYTWPPSANTHELSKSDKRQSKLPTEPETWHGRCTAYCLHSQNRHLQLALTKNCRISVAGSNTMPRGFHTPLARHGWASSTRSAHAMPEASTAQFASCNRPWVRSKPFPIP